MLAWILAIVLLHGLSSSLPNVTIDGASAYLPGSAASTQVALLQQCADRLAGQLQANTAIVVFAVSHGGLTPTDHAVVVAAREAVAGLVGHVTRRRHLTHARHGWDCGQRHDLSCHGQDPAWLGLAYSPGHRPTARRDLGASKTTANWPPTVIR